MYDWRHLELMPDTFLLFIVLNLVFIIRWSGTFEYQKIKHVISIRLQRSDFHLTSCVTYYTLEDPQMQSR